MHVKIDNFHGIQPRVHPSLLGAGMATRAHNCRLKRGKLVPLRNPKSVPVGITHRFGGLEKLGDANSLHAWKTRAADGKVVVNLLAFRGITWVAEGNIADDQYDRIFVSGDTGVEFAKPGGETVDNTPAVFLYDRSGSSIIAPHTLVKEPLSAVEAALDGSLEEGKTVFYVGFFASWYDDLGYESGISPAPDELIQINDGSSVQITVSGIPDAAAGIRVYMTRSGTTDTDAGIQFLYDKNLEAGHATEVETLIEVHPADTGELEPGIEPIPADMRALLYVPGGFYAGFAASLQRTVMFSEVGTATSWPIAYRYDVKDNIVTVVATANSVYALTDGFPWVLTGTAPDTMVVTKLAGPAACVSARGAVVYRNGVYFVSNEGVMAILNDATSGTTCTNITEKIFTKEQWLAKNPASCLMLQHDGALHLFFTKDDGEPEEGLIIDLTESENAVTTHDEAARCGCVDATTDTLYYVRNIGDGEEE